MTLYIENLECRSIIIIIYKKTAIYENNNDENNDIVNIDIIYIK